MFERNEKWIILAIIAFAVYYFYKKGKMQQAAPGDSTGQTMLDTVGSIVNTAAEPGTVRPAQSSAPILFRPAQPSTVPISQRVSVGGFNWYPAPPILRPVAPTRWVQV